MEEFPLADSSDFTTWEGLIRPLVLNPGLLVGGEVEMRRLSPLSNAGLVCAYFYLKRISLLSLSSYAKLRWQENQYELKMSYLNFLKHSGVARKEGQKVGLKNSWLLILLSSCKRTESY